MVRNQKQYQQPSQAPQQGQYPDVTPPTTKATWEQHLHIAQYLHSKGLTAEQTTAWFKPYNYTLNNLQYKAVRVSAMIAGLESSTQPAVVADPVGIINAQLADGTLKYTPTKLVHIPKVATPVIPAINTDEDEIPF